MHVSAEQLIDDLRREGLRITAPRRIVCDVIARSHGEHLTAAAIWEKANESGDARVDQATVYRTLEALERSGAVTHSHLGHAASVYHLSDEPPHQHLVCANCGTTVAVKQDDLVDLLEFITERTGFLPDPTHFALSGLCSQCAIENSSGG